MKKILILTANPKNTEHLELNVEVREIEESLQRANFRDRFQVVTKSATRIEDLRRALLDHRPQIVHFSGHGAGGQGLVLENDASQMQFVGTEALAGLFGAFEKSDVECVLLNACYSEIQAIAIHQWVDCVIGMNQPIGDKSAIQFAVGFYDALGAGNSYGEAYKIGCNAISLTGIPEFSTPVLRYRRSVTSVVEQPTRVEKSSESDTLSADLASTVNMTATGENAKLIGQIGRIDNFTM